jgi:hypothetical protein
MPCPRTWRPLIKQIRSSAWPKRGQKDALGDGVEELVQAHAIAWTKRAVRVRFGAPPHQHEVWVWAGAVERA